MLARPASICLALLCLVAAAAATGHAEPRGQPRGPAEPRGHAEPRAAPQIEVSPKAPRPGDPVLITVRGVDRAPRGTAGRVPLRFFAVRQGWQAVFAVPIDESAAELTISLAEPRLSQALTVTPRTWTEEQVKIDPEMAEPPADKRKLIDSDNAAIITGLRDREPPRFHGSFAAPGAGSLTSSYGAWRTLNGGYRSRHLGLDYAARMAAPVRAIQDGQVTLVRSGFLTGGTVVVIHGAGIASTYFHLDDIKVAVGDVIKRGAALGKVGMTGRTTGPHIHIGIWVPGGFVDPAAFLRLRISEPLAAAPK